MTEISHKKLKWQMSSRFKSWEFSQKCPSWQWQHSPSLQEQVFSGSTSWHELKAFPAAVAQGSADHSLLTLFLGPNIFNLRIILFIPSGHLGRKAVCWPASLFLPLLIYSSVPHKAEYTLQVKAVLLMSTDEKQGSTPHEVNWATFPVSEYCTSLAAMCRY